VCYSAAAYSVQAECLAASLITSVQSVAWTSAAVVSPSAPLQLGRFQFLARAALGTGRAAIAVSAEQQTMHKCVLVEREGGRQWDIISQSLALVLGRLPHHERTERGVGAADLFRHDAADLGKRLGLISTARVLSNT
jgi:hypothetical protein